MNPEDSIFDGYWYVAFIITAESEDVPGYVMVPVREKEGGKYTDYRSFMESDSHGMLSDDLWTLLDKEIRRKKKVYFSPDGGYHKFNLESFLAHDGDFAINTYSFRYVNSLKTLLLPDFDYGHNQYALLAGDPMFNMTLASVHDPVPGESMRGVSEIQTRMFPGTYLSDLPGTRVEVDSIGSMLNSFGWDCTTLTGREALENSISTARSPRVLHLATHGYFAETPGPGMDITPAEDVRGAFDFGVDSYARSCLFLSGAQSTLHYFYDYQEGNGDGILTAWEIMEMDLDSTELVVLSACDTGLGDVLSSGGIYGLRRAFHLAGARNVLISLWKVDDQATQLLMREFYSRWLSGLDMHTALYEAKLHLLNETEFKHPRYWAAFILSMN